MSAKPEAIHVGIDLGTSRSAISASTGVRHVLDSYVGWPVDMVARKLVKKPIRKLDDDTVDVFMGWLDGHFGSWWLPRTFFQIKMLSGCRLMDLCQARSAHLSGNVLTLIHTKTDEPRTITLPEGVEMKAEFTGIKE